MTAPAAPTHPGSPSPTRWAAAGFLGGASIVGMLWAIMGRAPAVVPMTAANASPASIAASPTQPISPLKFPTNPPPAKIVIVQAEPEAAEPTPADQTPGPAGSAATNQPSVQPEDPQPAAKKTTTSATPTAATVRLNINTASAAELELLPRIGPTLAGRIIEYRSQHGPIRSLRQLTEVKGIGARTIERLEPYIRFE